MILKKSEVKVAQISDNILKDLTEYVTSGDPFINEIKAPYEALKGSINAVISIIKSNKFNNLAQNVYNNKKEFREERNRALKEYKNFAFNAASILSLLIKISERKYLQYTSIVIHISHSFKNDLKNKTAEPKIK